MIEEFRSLLMEWFRRVQRDLPWRRTRDPYAVWVSEIMLQQTRVATVIPYYEHFLRSFPDVAALAAAPEDDLLAAWSGLGYYSRIRNMHRAAAAMGGGFPGTYEEIRSLPGIGEYTAAAVASIAFGLPHAAVDGNVTRVLSRVLDDDGDTGDGRVRKRLAAFAQRLLDPDAPGPFNEAMMELGATICLPRDPQCLVCPVQSLCAARAKGTQRDRPVKQRKAEAVRVGRTVYIVWNSGAVLLWQRPPDSPRLAGFWELPEAEHLAAPPPSTCIGHFQHSITHHNYTFEVHVAAAAVCRDDLRHAWFSDADLKVSPLSTAAKKALNLFALSRLSNQVACLQSVTDPRP